MLPRDYSAYESLLTQARILADYLKHWFIPELYTTGVFQDHFLKSTGILSPVTTLFGALFHIALISVSLVKRREWPLFAFAVLFFYGGHLLESSVLNLELYFEHRNYMTAAFLFLPLVVLLRNKVSQPMFFGVAIAALLVLGSFTRYSATVWQTFPSIVEASARKAPTSARAQAQYATQLFNAGRYEESLQVIDRAVEVIDTEDPLLLINRLIIHCQLGILSTSDFDNVADGGDKTFLRCALAQTLYRVDRIGWYGKVSRRSRLPGCAPCSKRCCSCRSTPIPSRWATRRFTISSAIPVLRPAICHGLSRHSRSRCGRDLALRTR